jgi:hypothetical protein
MEGKVVMRTGVAMVVAAMLWATQGVAQAKPDAGRAQIAEIVSAEIASDSQVISPAKVRAAIRPIRVDDDGVTDYAVNWEQFTFAAWCGTGGCRYQLWRGVTGGVPQIVFDRQVREVKLRKVGRDTIFDFDFHGSVCGGYGVELCPASFSWDAKAGRMVERMTRRGDGTVRYVSSFDGIDDMLPVTVAERLDARKAECKAMGGRTGDEEGGENDFFSATSVPDVDGDGARDWALIGNVCSFEGDRESINLPDEIWASAGDSARPALALAGIMFTLSVASQPAQVRRLMVSEECAVYSTEKGAKLCPSVPLVWDGASRRLRE